MHLHSDTISSTTIVLKTRTTSASLKSWLWWWPNPSWNGESFWGGNWDWYHGSQEQGNDKIPISNSIFMVQPNLIKNTLCVDYNLGTCSSRYHTSSAEKLSPTRCWVPAKGSWRGGLVGTCWWEPLGISIITKMGWSPIGLILPFQNIMGWNILMFDVWGLQNPHIQIPLN